MSSRQRTIRSVAQVLLVTTVVLGDPLQAGAWDVWAEASGTGINCTDMAHWWEGESVTYPSITYKGQTGCDGRLESAWCRVSMRGVDRPNTPENEYMIMYSFRECGLNAARNYHGAWGEWTATSDTVPPTYGQFYAVAYELEATLPVGYKWTKVARECSLSNSGRTRTCEYQADSKLFFPGESMLNSARGALNHVLGVATAVWDEAQLATSVPVCDEDNPGCVYGTTPEVWIEEADKIGTPSTGGMGVAAAICSVAAPGAVFTVVDVCDLRWDQGFTFEHHLASMDGLPGTGVEYAGPQAQAGVVGVGFFALAYVEACASGHGLYVSRDNPEELVAFSAEEVCRPLWQIAGPGE